jgi:hypothetical protein
MAKKFPEIKEKNEGKFTAWVEKNMGGMDTCKAASKIMRSRTKKYSPAVVKMANYANNFGCKTKKDDGASVPLKGKQKNLPEALKNKILASDGASVKDPDIKAAKKEIRKGANVLGGGNKIDEFGSKHGYQSKKTNELDNSRLVQRKKRQYRKDEAKANAKGYKGKEAKKDWKEAEDLGGTAKSRNKMRKQEAKDITERAKDRNKASKKGSKINRKIARLEKKKM